MNAEISLFGLFMPSLIVSAIVGYALTRLIARLLGYFGIYRLLVHPALINLSVFLCLVYGCAFIFGRMPQ